MVLVAGLRDRFSSWLRSRAAAHKFAAIAAVLAAVVTARGLPALAPVAALLAIVTPLLPGALARWRRGAASIAALAGAALLIMVVNDARPTFSYTTLSPLLLLVAKFALLVGLSAVLEVTTAPFDLAHALARPFRVFAGRRGDPTGVVLTLVFALQAVPTFAAFLRHSRDAARIRLGKGAPWNARLAVTPLVLRTGYAYAAAWGDLAADALILRGCATAGDWVQAAPTRRPAWGVVLLGITVAASAAVINLACLQG